jgi:hypothetical protein
MVTSHRLRIRPLGLLLVAALGVAALFSACGITSSGTGGGSTGTLIVHVLISPTAPVCHVSSPCSSPLPHRQVHIERTTGAVVATETTNQQGEFTVGLAPGSYVVRVVIAPGLPGVRQTSSGAVNITAGQTVSATIIVDSGIR